MVGRKITFLLLFLSLSLLVIGTTLSVVASEFHTLLYGVWGGCFFSIITVITLNKKTVKEYLFSRKSKRMLSSLLTVLLTLSILLILNFISRKKNISFDITKTKIHSLSQQSLNVLKKLDSPIEMNFFTLRNYWDNFEPLLKMYDDKSSLVNLQMFDIEKELLLTQQKDIREQNTIEVIYKKRSFKKIITSELDVTNLLIKVLSTQRFKIYYTVGHSEVNLSDTTKEGMSFFKRELENAQYELVAIDLLRVSSIPDDASMVMSLAPQSDLVESELKVLKSYIGKGGSTFSLLSPNFSQNKLVNWNSFYKSVGVKKINGLVLDRLSSTLNLDPSTVAISSLEPHEVTKGITSRLILPLNVVLEKGNLEDFIFTSLMKSSSFPGSWGETNLQSLEKGKVFYDKDDIKGPLDIGFLINSKIHTEASHGVFASKIWLTNQYQSQSAHFNLALNTISYILGDSSLISLNRPSLSVDPILLSQYELSLIFYFSVLFLPFAFFGLGIYFYQKRARG